MSVNCRFTPGPYSLLAFICVACLMFAGCGEQMPVQELELPEENRATANAPVPDSEQAEKPKKETSPKNPAAKATESAGGERFRQLGGKVKFKKEDGATAFSFKPQDDGAKLVDENEKELARFTVKPDRLKVKNPDDSEAGDIRVSAGRLKIDDPMGEKMFEFQRQADGDWKLDSKDEMLVYKIKKREYGYEIEAPDESSLFKIKLKNGKLSIRNPQDATVYSTKDPFSPLAAAVLVMDKIESQPLRAALSAAIALEVGGVKP